jgi:hypothetical protein
MHADRTGGYHASAPINASPPPPLGTVQGFGVTDALRIELHACQMPTMLAEIAELRDAFAQPVTAGSSPIDEAEDETRRYEVRVLDALRSQVADSLASTGKPVLCGPTALVLDLVAGAAHDAVMLLAAELDAKPFDVTSRERLRHAAATATAWITTYVDSRAVQWFTFDPDDGTPRL